MERSLLIVSNDVVGRRMAGMGLRYWELARALAGHLRVTLAAPHEGDLEPAGFAVAPSTPEFLKELAAAHDSILLQGETLWYYPFLIESGRPLIVDLTYGIYLLENLALYAGDGGASRQAWEHGLEVLWGQLRQGDFFLCASERQRDFWLGMLAAAGRLNPATYRADPAGRGVIGLVPFGLPSSPPQHRRKVLRGVVPGIGEDDFVLLWAGGIYQWLDPLTPLRALAEMAPEYPQVRLVFMGLAHPNPRIPPMEMAARAVALSHELGLHNRHAFFQEGWVPYEERGNYLLEADVGLSAHLGHLEARFACRTRLLDYIWAGLPMVVSAGDELSALVEGQGLGRAVAPGDVQGFGAALRELLGRCRPRWAWAARFAPWQKELTWERAAQPLLEFCLHPRPAADLGGKEEATGPGTESGFGPPGPAFRNETALRAKDAEIAALQATLERFQRGKVMRALLKIEMLKRKLLGRRVCS